MKKVNTIPSPRYENECLNWTCGEIALKYEIKERPSIQLTCPVDVCNFLSQNVGVETFQVQEHFFALYLDNARNLLGYKTISKGSTSHVSVDLKQILTVGLILNAQSIIVVHNHPSNNSTPSDADIEITKKLIASAYTCGMTLLDHIIITTYDFFSMNNKGILVFGDFTAESLIKEFELPSSRNIYKIKKTA